MTLVERTLMPTKLFSVVNCKKEIAKIYEGFSPAETPANPRDDFSIQEMNEFEGELRIRK